MQYDIKTKQRLCSKIRAILLSRQTLSEIRFSELLQFDGFDFIPQKGFYAGKNFVIVDFYLPKPFKLCIEIDGPYHNTPEQIERDKNKDFYLKTRGFKVLRMSNDFCDSLRFGELKTLIYRICSKQNTGD